MAGVAAAVVIGGALVWTNRWRLSRQVVQVVDPKVRAWAHDQVLEISDSAYLLSASPIRVDAERHRISIDTVLVTTDSVANARRADPLPALNLRFHNCAIDGIELDRLAAGGGLQATAAGCDSVAMVAEVPARRVVAAAPTADNDSTNFLALRGKLNLPRQLPFVGIDAVQFPHVSLSLGVTGRNGRRTAVALDRMQMRFDSVRYTRGEISTRPFLSKDVTVLLDGFSGSREAATRMEVGHLVASLGSGLLLIDNIEYEPIPGGVAEKIGIGAVQVKHLRMQRVNWRAFLTAGDIGVGELVLDTASVTILPRRVNAPGVVDTVTTTIETRLRALGRSVRLDSVALRSVAVQRGKSAGKDASATRIDSIALAAWRFSDDSLEWGQAFPLANARMSVNGISRRAGTSQLRIDALKADVHAGVFAIDNLRMAPEGGDSAFSARQTFRRDRVEMVAKSLRVSGGDFAAFVKRGEFASRKLDATGLMFDIYSDKRLPPSAVPKIRGYPQTTMQHAGFTFRFDTVALNGRIVYRERQPATDTTGVLRFENLRVLARNFSNDPATMTEKTPLLFRGDANLMGAGALHVEFDVPLLAKDFRMEWRGRLGAMDPQTMNTFLPHATGMRFTSGQIESIEWVSSVRNGHGTGQMIPRWHGLGVRLPGVARTGGFLSGLKRTIAEVAANAFVVNDDNRTEDPKAKNGTIDFQWDNTQTLPKFVWFSLREALTPVLKN